MKNVTIFLGAYAMSALAFALFTIWQRGWDQVTYGGQDHWTPLFMGAGAAGVPAVISLIVTGVIKLARREAEATVVWCWALFLSSAVVMFLQA